MNKDTLSNEVKLTHNEQKVLKQIIQREKVSDTSIAGDMKISQQAVNQIRARLENLGVIKGYTPVVDFEKIGVKIILLLGITLTHKVWENKKEWEIEQNLKKIPFVFQAYRITGHDVSHVVMMGFRNDTQRDKFLKKLQTVYKDEMNVKWSYSISSKDVMIQDNIALLYQIIDDKPFEFESLFL